MSAQRHSLTIGFGGEWIVTEEQLFNNTPSRYDGISYDQEIEMRTTACERIDNIRNAHRKIEGQELRDSPSFMRQQVVVTAKLLLQRFYTQHSFKTHPWQDVALAALFLAAKLEDRPMKLVLILNKFFLMQDKHHVDFVDRSRDEEYLSMKEQVLKYERIILNTLAYNFTYSSTQQAKTLKTIVRRLVPEKAARKKAESTAKTLLNDSFSTVACLLYSPDTIAGAMVYLGLRMSGGTTSVEGEKQGEAQDVWIAQFGASKKQVSKISSEMLSLYDRKLRSVGKTSLRMVNLRRAVERELGDLSRSSDPDTSNAPAPAEPGTGGGGHDNPESPLKRLRKDPAPTEP